MKKRAGEILGAALLLFGCVALCYGSAWIFVLVGVPN